MSIIVLWSGPVTIRQNFFIKSSSQTQDLLENYSKVPRNQQVEHVHLIVGHLVIVLADQN